MSQFFHRKSYQEKETEKEPINFSLACYVIFPPKCFLKQKVCQILPCWKNLRGFHRLPTLRLWRLAFSARLRRLDR